MSEQKKAVISAAIVLVVNIFALCNVSLDKGLIESVVFGAISLAATLYAAWKNHNFTEEAAQAQQYLEVLKERSRNASNDQ